MKLGRGSIKNMGSIYKFKFGATEEHCIEGCGNHINQLSLNTNHRCFDCNKKYRKLFQTKGLKC